jgi:spermine oxidase
VFVNEKEKLWSEKTVHCADLNGVSYDEKIAYEMISFFDDLVGESRSFWILKKECPFNSYEEFINKRLEEYIKNDSVDLKSLKRAILRQQSKVLCFEIGCTRLTESSVKEYGSYVRFDDTNHEFPGGYSKLVKFLSDKLPEESIKLNHPVDEILVDVGVIVKCKNGTVFNADHVIVTSSLNFLKENYKTFLPRQLITEDKIAAISSLKMGYVNKFVLVYDDMSFYPQDKDSLHILHLENDYDCENYNVKTDWYKKIGKFDRFFGNILRALITGDEAIHVESISEEEIAVVLTGLMRKALKNDDIPLPTRVIRYRPKLGHLDQLIFSFLFCNRTKWCTNPYILGSYTFVTQDSISTKHFHDLAEPLYQDGIVSCGEKFV